MIWLAFGIGLWVGFTAGFLTCGILQMSRDGLVGSIPPPPPVEQRIIEP